MVRLAKLAPSLWVLAIWRGNQRVSEKEHFILPKQHLIENCEKMQK